MYSFTPYADPSADHTGFYLLILLCALIFALYYFIHGALGGEEESWVAPSVISALILPVAFYFSYIKQGDPPPANMLVVAQLVDEYEGVETRRVSKRKKANFPVMFVVYRTPEGDVTFRKHDGVVYPKLATLYKK